MPSPDNFKISVNKVWCNIIVSQLDGVYFVHTIGLALTSHKVHKTPGTSLSLLGRIVAPPNGTSRSQREKSEFNFYSLINMLCFKITKLQQQKLARVLYFH